jgi:hypothetical protein
MLTGAAYYRIFKLFGLVISNIKLPKVVVMVFIYKLA